jgi:hypothetical protein
MTQAVWSFLTASIGFLAVFGAWLAIQSLVRAWSGASANTDTLDHLAHGCAGCKNAGVCASRKTQGEHHEPTRIRH